MVGGAAGGACSGASQLPADERVRLELIALRVACARCREDVRCAEQPELDAVCDAFTPPPPVITSGDSGPPLDAWSGPGEGNGVRSLGGAPGR